MINQFTPTVALLDSKSIRLYATTTLQLLIKWTLTSDVDLYLVEMIPSL